MICPNCRQQTLDGSNFCDSCGAVLSPAAQPSSPGAMATLPSPMVQTRRDARSSILSVCPKCQTTGSATYCDHCGTPLDHGIAYPPPAVALPVQALPRLILQPAHILFPFPSGKHEAFIGREDPKYKLIPDINFEAYGGADAGVSRRHARVHFDGAQWHLEHLSQTNQTFVNDAAIAYGQSRPLKNGDIVLIGRLTLLFRI